MWHVDAKIDVSTPDRKMEWEATNAYTRTYIWYHCLSGIWTGKHKSMPGNISIENIFITCLCIDVHFIEMKSKHSPYFMHVFEKKYMN